MTMTERMTAVRRCIAIGECMVELAPAQDGLYRVGYAGDTFNTAWYLQASLDIQNIYNHTNTEFFVPTFDFKDDVAIPGLPILPALGIKGVF